MKISNEDIIRPKTPSYGISHLSNCPTAKLVLNQICMTMLNDMFDY